MCSGIVSAKNVLVLGDSISAAYGMDTSAGWVQLLRQRMQQQSWKYPSEPAIINASISGETTTGGLTRLPALLQKHQPELVIIELGANDGLRGTPLRMVEKNLSTLISTAKTSGADILLLGMRLPPNYGRRYADSFFQMFGRIAERHEIAYYPFFLERIGGVSALMQPDGIHPNHQAQPLLLDNIWPLLEPLLTRK
ncbi:MAG: arylesterase [Motiliproteus sp.]